MTTKPSPRRWSQRLSRSGYFLLAVLLHLVVLTLVASWIIFPANKPVATDFGRTPILPAPAKVEPPVATLAMVNPTSTSTTPPLDLISTQASPVDIAIHVPDPVANSTTSGGPVCVLPALRVSRPDDELRRRMSKIKDSMGHTRDPNSFSDSNGNPRNVTAKFPLYIASYSGGDWNCNTSLDKGGKIVGGGLPNFVEKMGEWSRHRLNGTVAPQPLDIASPELLDKCPPFIFFTGHKDFVLSDKEIANLSQYLQIGGAIWGDNSLGGRGSRFDVAFRREMKRVVPDADKNFEPYTMRDDLFTKSWFPLEKVPQGMNYFAEPLEHLDIDGKLAILYTPNDYSDLLYVHILPGDSAVDLSNPPQYPLFTDRFMWDRRDVFYCNLGLDSSLAAQRLAMNIIGYLLVRFDDELMLGP